jgi:hypothetical protein
MVLPFFNLLDHPERVWDLDPRTRSFKFRGVVSFYHIRLGRPMSRRSLGCYRKYNLGRRIVFIPFRWSNQFFLRSFQIFYYVIFFSLFRIVEFLWLSFNFSPNSYLKNPVFLSLKSVSLNKKTHLRVAILMAGWAWHKPQKWRNVNTEHYKNGDWQGELK